MVRTRDQLKQGLHQSHEDSYKNKDDSGKYATVFIKSLPAAFKTWVCKEGEHLIDIIPFLVGDKFPGKKKGQSAHVLDIWRHDKIGPTEDNWICPARTLKENCPICEHQNYLREKLKDISDKDQAAALEADIKKLNPGRRCIYNIVVLDSPKDEAEGVRVWEVAHFLSEKHLAELSKRPRGGGYVYYSDPDDGKSVSFRRKGSGQTSTEYLAWQFIDRNQSIPDEILESVWQLDQYVHWPSYEELWEAYFQDAYKGQTVSEYLSVIDGGEPETQRRTLPPPRTTTQESSPAEDDIPFDKGEAEAAPEQAVEESSPQESSDSPCPEGFAFGEELDRHPECNGCPEWDACASAYDKILEEKKKKRAAEKTSNAPAKLKRPGAK